ncbi:DinB family protein [Bacteroidota bacterium]
MVRQLIPLKEIIKLNTRLFINLLEDVTEEIAYKRMDKNSNPIIFIVIHLLDARFYIARFCGVKNKNPFKEKFDAIKSSDDLSGLPRLDEIKNVWNDISTELVDGIGSVSEGRLEQNPRMEFPVEDKTIIGAITFLTQHESYHLGQIGLLRKSFGLSPLKYN